MQNTDKPPTAQELEQAFSLFNEASVQLAGAYQDLQLQVGRLTAELAVANGELRRQYEEKEALSRRLALLLEALPGGVLVLDAQGMIREANPAALELIQSPHLGSMWSDVERQRLAATATPQEWRLRRSDGELEERWVSVYASELDLTGGRILLLSDITEAYRMREQLERHKKLSAMGEMAAGLAHQLRTPLATALLYAGNLTRQNLPPAERQRFAEKALVRLKDLERMIQEMLVFVRGTPSAQEVIELPQLVHELAQVMEPHMAQHGLRFAVECGDEQGRLRGNRQSLSGALINLLENALQACEPGGEVRLQTVRDGASVLIQVVDSGRGMDAAVRERLFEPFFTTRGEGTGLGLAIVRSVIEAHGGKVSVQSTPDAGSVFSVRLPRLLAT